MRSATRPGLLGAVVSWLALSVDICAAAWPNTPFKISGRWITDATGANVTHVGANWPGHGEVMIPEGLQHQSIANIVTKIKSLGMNAVRLTYATEMIDQIYANGDEDITIDVALNTALGRENGTKVLESIIKNNPDFSATTTRLQVFDAVAAECAKQEIYIVLDNHVSKAGWCCNPFDGNSWWGDTHFGEFNWIRGLAYMAEHSKSWPALTTLSLRNELRQPLTNWTLMEQTYNWETWHKHTQLGAAAIHAANPSPLIFLSGMDSSTQFDVLVRGLPLNPSTVTFNRTAFAPGFEEKLALEMHAYSILEKPKDCDSMKKTLFEKGFETLTDEAVNQFPLLVTEFGFGQDEETWKTDVYATCIAEYLPEQRVGWFVWVIAGSYYVRDGTQEYEESWGLLDAAWEGWRNPEFVEGGLRKMVDATFAAVQSSVGDGGGDAAEGGSGGNGDGNGNGNGGGDGSGEDGQTQPGPGENAAGRSLSASWLALAWSGVCALALLGSL